MPTARVVSLIASATEIVAALGCEDRLVGRSHECDFPPAVRELPVCTSARLDVHADSAAIDRQVKSLLADAVSIYSVHADVLQRLEPDVIVTQSQCEVCAVSLKDVEQAVCRLVGSQPRVVSLEPNGLADIWTTIRQVAAALEVKERGEKLIAGLQGRLDDIRRRSARLVTRPTAACIEWIEPLMAAGNWMPELVEIAGGANLFGQPGRHSPWMKWEELVAEDPDVIFISPCGFDIQRTMEETHLLAARTQWNHLKAVRNSCVFVADGNQYFNRPGPRLVESLEILAELLHPELFHFGHETTGWIRLKDER